MTNKEEFPSLPEQGKNIADLLAKAIRDAVEGNELFASEFEQQRRYDQICDYEKYLSENGTVVIKLHEQKSGSQI